MSYQSPIDIIMHDMQMKTEDEICKAVQKVGINVDKDELIRALQYDRKQYQKGYADRDAEIVRCKDCKHRPKEIPFITSYGEDDIYLEYPKGSKCPCRNTSDEYYSWNPSDDWYCAEGERGTE